MSTFKYDMDLPIPAPAREGRTSETRARLLDMPVGGSFLIPVEVPAKIKDKDERAKAFKDLASQNASRMSGHVRRMRQACEKAGDKEVRVFAVRVVNDKALGVGVRVYRTAA